MKQCPVCKARCFDDMEICYGCLHHFNADQHESGNGAGVGSDGEADLEEEFDIEPAPDPVGYQASALPEGSVAPSADVAASSPALQAASMPSGAPVEGVLGNVEIRTAPEKADSASNLTIRIEIPLAALPLAARCGQAAAVCATAVESA